MMRTPAILALACGLLFISPCRADEVPGKVAAPILLDDFEAEFKGWKFVGGEEFPGAKGALTRDSTAAHGGKFSSKLDADFRGGGAYVGSWKDLEAAGLPDIEEFRMWVRPGNLKKLGVRIVDGTGQCHQKTIALPAGPEDGWRELVLKVKDLAGGEHWGGANDGAWHGPPKGLGLNIGKDSVGDVAQIATLRIDDLTAVPIRPGKPLLLSCSITPGSCRPGFGTRISYAWDAEPLGTNCNVFVHFVNAKSQMVFQADHEPPVPTSRWTGRVEYARTITVPTDAPIGKYDVVIGFWDGKSGSRKPFHVGPGLTALPHDAARVGTLEIAVDAPLPKLPARSLNLDGFTLTFDEDFREPLSISAWGPGTR